MQEQNEASSVYVVHIVGTGGPPSPVTPEDVPLDEAVPDDDPVEVPDPPEEPPEEPPLDDVEPDDPVEPPEEDPDEPPDELLGAPVVVAPAHAAMPLTSAAANAAWRTFSPLARRPIACLPLIGV
jgi:hypothetical protein